MLKLPMEVEVQKTIDSFIGYLVSERGLSENTITAYRNDLNQFLGFLELEKPSNQITSNRSESNQIKASQGKANQSK